MREENFELRAKLKAQQEMENEQRARDMQHKLEMERQKVEANYAQIN